ncbi:hypothetical protein LIER_17589 [Lithospermum erythrorhizon]|uniref:CRIB domain-containing protein n=1 Tax=Lithospermum erythrorhizon TaxID=34254 RepID=A0AAV3QAU6_LITER
MSCMGMKMKGVFRGFNKRISHIFVEKEREIEIEIGCPRDVQHVGHIGWDGSAGDTDPSWMGEIETGPEFASSSIGRNSAAVSAWPSTQAEEPPASKKHRRKKHKKSSSSSTSSPTHGGDSGSSRRRSKHKKDKAKRKNIEVAS